MRITYTSVLNKSFPQSLTPRRGHYITNPNNVIASKGKPLKNCIPPIWVISGPLPYSFMHFFLGPSDAPVFIRRLFEHGSASRRTPFLDRQARIVSHHDDLETKRNLPRRKYVDKGEVITKLHLSPHNHGSVEKWMYLQYWLPFI